MNEPKGEDAVVNQDASISGAHQAKEGNVYWPIYPVSLEALRQGKEYTSFNRQNDSQKETYDLDLILSQKNKKRGEFDRQKPETLGLHYGPDGKIYPSHFVGAVWLEKPGQGGKRGVPLIVKPKIEDIDAVTMFTQVAAYGYPESMESLYGFMADEPLVEGKPLQDLSLFQVAVYLKELAQFCQRELRIDFTSACENLEGRVKGKVLIMENLRCNLVHSRLEKVACRFERMTIDTPANRILKWALKLSMKFLTQYPQEKNLLPLWNWARNATAALSRVSETKMTPSDFLGNHYGGLMQRYKKMHALARVLIRRLRIDAEGKVEEIEEKGETVPFWIDMDKLFEGYVGVLLRQTPKADFEAQKEGEFEWSINKALFILRRPKRKAENASFVVRPDYIAKDRSTVVDAKYKEYLQTKEDGRVTIAGKSNNLSQDEQSDNFGYRSLNDDIYQVIAYSTLFAGNAPMTRRAFLAVPFPKKQDKEEQGQILKAWAAALLEKDFEGNEHIPHFKVELILGYRLLVGILPTPLPIRGVGPNT